MRDAGGRVSGKVGARKRVIKTLPFARSMNAETYALSRFDRKPPLPPTWSRSAGPTSWEPVTPIPTADRTLTNLRHFGGPLSPVAGRSGSSCWAIASLPPDGLGLSSLEHGDGAPAPAPLLDSTVTVGRPTPPLSSRPLSGM